MQKDATPKRGAYFLYLFIDDAQDELAAFMAASRYVRKYSQYQLSYNHFPANPEHISQYTTDSWGAARLYGGSP